MSDRKWPWKPRIWQVVLVVFVLGKTLWVSALYVSGDQLVDGAAQDDLFHRHAFLKDAITVANDERPDKQILFSPRFQGEWAITSCSMYSMALCNLGFLYPQLRAELIQEIQTLIERVKHKTYRQFDAEAWNEDPLDSMASGHGHIWYLGHLNLMLSFFRLLGGDTRYDALMHDISDSLSRAIAADSVMMAQTYPNERYTPDNSMALCSLKNHDVIFGTHYDEIINRWVETTTPKLIDKRTGTLVFAITEGAAKRSRPRSSGATFACLYLFHAHPEFFSKQYDQIKRLFGIRVPALGSFPGVGALKENADGSSKGDVDSGPVIFGVSTSGTGFGIGCARAAQDRAFLSQLLMTAEPAGCSVDWNGQRHYLLAPMVGEAIMLAMKTSTPWDGRYLQQVEQH